jgi:2-polyprenyl-6-methoxyphenol hydroxylase-like FAD-dependent oxidoreductase
MTEAGALGTSLAFLVTLLGRRCAMSLPRRHAVVLGASWAGLVHAVPLAERFDKVALVDRDVLPHGPRSRRGVPQDQHIHLLVPGGLARLEELLPGATGDMSTAGAHVIAAEDWRFHMGGGQLNLVEAGVHITGATRPLIESVVRDRVLELDRVELLDGWSVQELTTTADRGAVTGVRVASGADGHAERDLSADLVVDTTGRGSRTPRWLVDLGYGRVEEQRLKIDVHYTTRLFRRDPADLDGCKNVLVDVPPDGTRGGVALAVEGERWLVTLIGIAGERPPIELDEFVGYARSLSVPDLYDIVSGAEPLGEACHRAFPASYWRRYDRLPRVSERYVVSGDAVCSFDPRFGQGMTVALVAAIELRRVLDEGDLGDAGPRLLSAARWAVQDAWEMATGSDLANPRITGPRPMSWRITNTYMQRLLRAAQQDPVVASAFIRVIGMLARPSELMHARVLSRVLTGSLLRHRAGRPSRHARAGQEA